jgi:hypothetical protein
LCKIRSVVLLYFFLFLSLLSFFEWLRRFCCACSQRFSETSACRSNQSEGKFTQLMVIDERRLRRIAHFIAAIVNICKGFFHLKPLFFHSLNAIVVVLFVFFVSFELFDEWKESYRQ